MIMTDISKIKEEKTIKTEVAFNNEGEELSEKSKDDNSFGGLKIVDSFYNFLHTNKNTIILFGILFAIYPFVLMIISIKFKFADDVQQDIKLLAIFFSFGIYLIIIYTSVYYENYKVMEHLMSIIAPFLAICSIFIFWGLNKWFKYFAVLIGLFLFLKIIPVVFKIILNFMKKLEPKDQLIIILPIISAIISFIFKVNFSFK